MENNMACKIFLGIILVELLFLEEQSYCKMFSVLD